MTNAPARLELGWFARNAIRCFAPREIVESFAGDLLEEANERVLATRGKRATERWMFGQVVRSLPRFAWMNLHEGGGRRMRIRLIAASTLLVLHATAEWLLALPPKMVVVTVLILAGKLALLAGLLFVRSYRAYLIAAVGWYIAVFACGWCLDGGGLFADRIHGVPSLSALFSFIWTREWLDTGRVWGYLARDPFRRQRV